MPLCLLKVNSQCKDVSVFLACIETQCKYVLLTRLLFTKLFHMLFNLIFEIEFLKLAGVVCELGRKALTCRAQGPMFVLQCWSGGAGL